MVLITWVYCSARTNMMLSLLRQPGWRIRHPLHLRSIRSQRFDERFEFHPFEPSYSILVQVGCLYRVDAILCVVDAKHIQQHLDDVREEGVVNEAVQQVTSRRYFQKSEILTKSVPGCLCRQDSSEQDRSCHCCREGRSEKDHSFHQFSRSGQYCSSSLRRVFQA